MQSDNSLKNYEESEIHRKKILALRNYSETLDEFHEWPLLELLVSYLERGLIHRKLHHVIDDLFDIYRIDYKQWWFKNRWVRRQICLKHEKDKNTQVFDFYEKMSSSVHFQGKGWLYPSKVYKRKNYDMGERRWL